MKYPRQLPVPTAWIKAFILSAFVFTAEEAEAKDFDPTWIDGLMNEDPELAIFFVILLILSPIAIIAILHYLSHFLLGALSSKLISDRVQKQPVLISLWEGVYGWLIICVATLAMIALWTSSVGGFSFESTIPIALRLTWLATAAYLYHLEYSTRQK